MKYFILLMAIGISAMITSCSSTGVTGASVQKMPSKVAYLSSDRPLDDSTIHNAITKQLQQRGYKVVDRVSTPPQTPVSGIIVRYMDVWKWDFTMYLRTLDIKISDGRNSHIISMANFKNGFLHSYPDSKKVVNKLFMEFDNKGVF